MILVATKGKSALAPIYRHLKTSQLMAVVFTSAMLSACGGGGGSDGSGSEGDSQDSSNDNSGPDIVVLSPTISSSTTSKTILVTGEARDSTQVDSILFNGRNVTTDNQFDSWEVSLPIEDGLEQIEVVARDILGNESLVTSTLRINRITEIFDSATDLFINSQNQEVVISDSLSGQIFKADLSNATFSKLTLTSANTPTTLNQSRLTKSLPTSNSAFSIDINEANSIPVERIRELNINTGNLEEVVELNEDSGLAFAEFGTSRVIDLIASPLTPVIYLISINQDTLDQGELWEYTTDSNTLRLLSNTATNNTGQAAPQFLDYGIRTNSLYYIDNGDLFRSSITNQSYEQVSDRLSLQDNEILTALELDESNNRAWVVDSGNKLVSEIDLQNGQVSLVSSNSQQTAPLFKRPTRLTYDEQSNKLLIADAELNSIISIDLSTGHREYFVSNRYGTGPLLDTPVDVALHASGDYALVTDPSLNAIVRIDLQTGDRTLLSKPADSIEQTVGSGPEFSAPASIVLSENLNLGWTSDRTLSSIFTINLSNGDRNELDLSYSETAKTLTRPSGLSLSGDIATPSLLVSGLFNDSVQAIASDTGSVSLLGSGQLNDGNQAQKIIATASSRDLTQVYGLDSVLKGVIEWDTQAQSGRMLSRVFVGSGPNFSDPRDIQIAQRETILYVSDAKKRAIFQVDIDTGDRSIVSNNDVGEGPVFKNPQGIALDEANNRILVVDSDEKALFEVNLSTGERMIVSR